MKKDGQIERDGGGNTSIFAAFTKAPKLIVTELSAAVTLTSIIANPSTVLLSNYSNVTD
jgi:hypothetical protein